MNRLPFRMAAVFACAVSLALTSFAESPDGFAIWSEGTGKARTLHKLELRKGRVPDPSKKQMICRKGPLGGDIEGVISYDGKWLAFARDAVGTGSKYGPNDYHFFGNWDIHIVRLDGKLPAGPKRIARGYFPSWASDGDGKKVTLYYCVYQGKRIDKVVIDVETGALLDGPKVHYKVPTRERDLHMQCSPDGRKVAARERGTMWVYWTDGKKTKLGGGCHPSWCADSYWLVYGRHKAYNINGHCGNGRAGGDYHYGSSNDVKWFITRTEQRGNDQNTGHDVSFFTLRTTKQEFVIQKQHSVTKCGQWPDIHVYTDGIPGKRDASREAGGGPKKASAPPKKAAPSAKDEAERKAEDLYRSARQAESMGQPEAAVSFYSKIVKDYAGTSFAERAAKRLKSLAK